MGRRFAHFNGDCLKAWSTLATAITQKGLPSQASGGIAMDWINWSPSSVDRSTALVTDAQRP